MRKKCIIVCGAILLSMVFTSCRPDHVDTISSTIEETETLKDLDKVISENIVTREKVAKPTIDFDELLIESVEESRIEESTAFESDKSEVLSSDNDSTTSQNPLDMMFDEDDRVYHGNAVIDTSNWKYGMTPCEWVYVEPGIQLISNYKPNTSRLYSANSEKRVSSGLKGCFVPIFSKTDMLSNDYDGRMYVFSDYSKNTPEEMLFSNSLKTVTYKDIPIEEILRMSFDVERTNNGLLVVNGEYINAVYVVDLDRILNGY